MPHLDVTRLKQSAAFFGATLFIQPLFAQTADSGTFEDGEIIVSATSLRGAVETEVPAVLELSEADIASYGATSVQDLVAAISSQTSSSRGRGGGQPIVLINGQRTSGFREIRDLPPEAIQKVEVFPEEVALQYGYRPDQRVINFILKDNYTGLSVAGEYGVPTQGGQGRSELETTVTRIGKNSRLNVNLVWQRSTAITESERDIVQDAAGALVDLGDFRTLAAPTDNVELNANYSRTFDNGTVLSLNGDYVFDRSRGLSGLPNGTLQVGGDPLFRYFTQFGPLNREQESHSAKAGIALNGKLSDWRWALSGDFSRDQVRTNTDRSGDITALQAAIDAGTVDPVATDFGPLLGLPFTDQTRSIDRKLNSLATISGAPLILPSGPVNLTLRSGFNYEKLDGRESRRGIVTTSQLNRRNINGGISIDVPLADENADVVDAIGRLSINGNLGFSDLSDFGGLTEFGYGLTWEPTDGLVFTATAIGEEAAPSVSQLGSPVIVTPDVTVFDFTRGTSVLAAITTGGNPTLVAEKRRDVKLALNYRPQWLDGMTFLGEYFRNNSNNVASNFPLLTPEIEAAFPERVTRDTTGQLTAIDRRPVSYANIFSERIRYGFDFSKRFGGGGRGEGRGERRGQAPAATQGASGGGRPGGGMGGGAMPGREGGRWQASLYHTIQLEDRILIRPGVAELDLLNGSATGSTGGSPRHQFELSGGWFNKGIGLRIDGKHQSASKVNGIAGSDLRFSDLTTLNMRLFINLDNRGKLTERFRFLKGSRIALRIDNIFNDIQDVRDNSGLVPLSYQPGFLDPVGRYIEIDFRKRF